MSQLKKPDIFGYQDILEFLKDIYKFRKRNENSFSYEAWANEMEFRSRSYLRAIVLGEKPLQEHLLKSLLKGLTLDSDETRYFAMLLKFHCASTPELKNLYARDMLNVWKIKLQETTLTDIQEFLSDPMIPTLFTYLSFDGVSQDPATMARDLKCDLARIQQALRCLIWNKLVEPSVGEGGGISYRTSTPFFKIPSSPGNIYLKHFHAEGLKQAQMATDLPSSSRKYYSTFVTLSEDQLSMVANLIQDFNVRLLGILEKDRGANKKIYRLNQQLFPVSEKMTVSPRDSLPEI